MADGISYEALSGMGSAVLGAGKDLVSSAVGMGGELLSANQKLSDYSNALSGNTKVFGALKNTINGLVQFAESSLEEYQTLTGIGATFGKEMVNIKRTAAELGLTTKDMIEMLQNNSASLRAFGGTTDQAISRFRAFSKEVLDSDAGTELRRLGFTAKDINQTLITYNEIAQQDGLVNRRSAVAQRESAKAFALELDGLSKLTGKQKDELADEMKKRRREGDVQAFLMGQSAEAQEAFTMATTKISNTMGPQFAELFKDMMIRGAPITEDTRNAFIALGGSAGEFEDTVASFKQGMNSNDFSGFNAQLTEAQGSFAGYLKTEEARNVAMLGGLSSVSSAMGQAYESSYDFANSLDAAAEGAETPAQTMERLQLQIAEEQAVQMADTGKLLDTTIALQESLRDLTIVATSQVLPRLEEAALTAINMFREAMPSGEEMAQQLGDGISNIFDAANASVYPEALATAFENVDAANGDDIQTAADRITGTQVEAGEAVATTVTETSAELSNEISDTQSAVEQSQTELAKLQSDYNDARERGDTEVMTVLRDKIDETRAALQSAIVEQAQAYTASQVSRYQSGGKFAGGFANGGRIGAGEFGLMGENGPEFVSGPAQVMSTNSSMGVLQNLLKTIKSVDSNVQESSKSTADKISNIDSSAGMSNDLTKRFDHMISVLEMLVSIEGEAAGTARRHFKATKGLQGNMVKGIGA